MSTYSNAPAVNIAVTGTANTATVLYTCSASSYALVNLCVTGIGGTWSILVGGRLILDQNSVSGISTYMQQITVGPSQAVEISATSGAITATVSGVEFTNQA